MAPGSPVAAGGVPWRSENGRLVVAVVHRPKYDDWSFPKGSVEDGETPLDGARREVREETGLRVTAGRRLLRVTYRAAGVDKTVDYWAMSAAGSFVANDEVDEIAWLPAESAEQRLSYADDRGLLADLLSCPLRPVTVLLVRHARAGDRSNWAGPDDDRPLDDRGRAEAAALAGSLSAFAPTRILSGAPLRCRQTVQPLADRLDLPMGGAPEFSEDGYAADPATSRARLRELLRGEAVSVVCSQGGVIPELISLVQREAPAVTGVSPTRTSDWPPSRKASVWTLTADSDGSVLSADYYSSFLPPT